MIDLSKHIQEGARLELEAMERLAEECSFCSSMSAQHSAQAMQIDELKRDLAAANARAEQLRQELTNIATANPRTWGEDQRDQFQAWAQNRARHCLATIDAAIAARKDGA